MKKIGQYLPFLLALVAFGILLFSAGGKDAPAGTEPPETGSTVQTTGETFPTEEPRTEPEETRAKDALARVEQALDRYPLDETAMALCIYERSLHDDGSTTGAGKEAHAHALARLCDEQRMNPVAAFWLLARESLYEYAADGEKTISAPAFSLTLQARKEYPFTADGTRELLTDILSLSGAVDDGLHMETKILGENGKVDADQVHYDEEDCYYAYFIHYGERSAHFLCFYTRGAEQIDDLEFQLLNLRYASGDEEELNRIDQLGDRQAAALMAAAEQLLSGSSKADEGRIPMSYSVDGYGVDIERFRINGEGETGILTNYAIRKEG